MRTKMLAAFAILGTVSMGCGGEEPPPPQAPPPPSVAPAPPPPASSAPEAPPPPAKPSMAELVPQTLKNVSDAFNAHDAAKFAASYAADATATLYGGPEEHSRDDIAKGIKGLFDMSSDIKGGAEHLWSKGNVVAVDWVSAGTMTGDFMGMKASKKPFGNHRLVIATLNDDGLMTSAHEYVDMPGMMAQLKGAKDAPPVPTVPATTDIHFAKNTPEEDKVVDWFKTFGETFNKGDVKALSPSFDAGSEVNIFFQNKTLKGSAEIDKFHAEMFKKMPGAQFVTNSAFGCDGFVVGERTLTVKVKGKDASMHIGEVLQPSVDGKVQHAWVFGNMGEMAPPPAAKAAAPAAAPKAAAPAAAAKPAAPAAAAKPVGPAAPKK